MEIYEIFAKRKKKKKNIKKKKMESIKIII